MELSDDSRLLLSRKAVAVSIAMVLSAIQITAWWQITSLGTTGRNIVSFVVVAVSSLDNGCMCTCLLEFVWDSRGSCDQSVENIFEFDRRCQPQ